MFIAQINLLVNYEFEKTANWEFSGLLDRTRRGRRPRRPVQDAVAKLIDFRRIRTCSQFAAHAS